MSFHLESNQGIEITDEQEFRTKICGQCKWEEICDALETKTGYVRLFANKTNETNSRPYIGGMTGKKGVYRCAHFESKEHIEALT